VHALAAHAAIAAGALAADPAASLTVAAVAARGAA
jgi:hypothetical protein